MPEVMLKCPREKSDIQNGVHIQISRIAKV